MAYQPLIHTLKYLSLLGKHRLPRTDDDCWMLEVKLRHKSPSNAEYFADRNCLSRIPIPIPPPILSPLIELALTFLVQACSPDFVLPVLKTLRQEACSLPHVQERRHVSFVLLKQEEAARTRQGKRLYTPQCLQRHCSHHPHKRVDRTGR